MRESSPAVGPQHMHWLVIAAGVCAALHLAKLSPAVPQLRDTLGISLLQAGFLLSLVQLAGMLLGLIGGAVADGIGLKRSMASGLLLLSLSATAGGWAAGAAELLLLRALEGLGFLLVVLPGPGLIRQLVPRQRMQAALGYWGAYMPLGTALALLVGPFVLQALGWRWWWWSLAALAFITSACLWLALPGQPASTGSPAAGPAGRVLGSLLPRVRKTLGATGPWLLALSFASYSGQWLAVVGFLPSITTQQQGSPGWLATSLLALVALVNMAGNIASGRLLQRGVPPQFLLYLGFGSMGVGSVLAFLALPATGEPASWSMWRYAGVLAFSMVGGLVPGTLFSLAPLFAPDDSSVSTTVGWMQQWSAAGQVVGPPVVAWMAAWAGTWQWTWVFTVACCAVGAGLARRIARRAAR